METGENDQDPLFDPDLLDSAIGPRCGVPDRFVLRPLWRGDHDRGHTAVLATLSPCALTRAEHRARFAALQRCNAAAPAPGLCLVVVAAARSSGRVVASATALLEPKFTHGAGRVAHIEDVAVHPDARGQHLATALVTQLVALARHAHCHKAVLACAPPRRTLYARCGFVPHEIEMVLPLTEGSDGRDFKQQ